MTSKVLTLLLSLAAQSGVYARPTGPRAIAEISTALVLLDAPSRAWAFAKYSPGSENVCGELCEWDAIAYRDEDDNPPSNPPSCGDRITFVINQEGKPALEACAQVAAEFPDICGMCEPIIPTDDWTDEPTPMRDPRLLRPPARKRRNSKRRPLTISHKPAPSPSSATART